MPTIVQMIDAAFSHEGYSKAGIAGLLGNWDVESDFNPSNVNQRENAHGFAQWEGGRLTNLENYASQHGGSINDPNIQIGFAIQELKSSYPAVDQYLRTATDPAAAAAFVDQNYEVSSGAARQQRIDDAVAFFNSNLQGGPGGDVAVTGATQAGNAQDAAFNIPVPNPLSPFLPPVNIDPFQWFNKAKSAVSSIPDALKLIGGSLSFIAEFFHKLVWIFTPSHFIKMQLYIIGFIFIVVGFGMLVWGAGKERPAN